MERFWKVNIMQKSFVSTLLPSSFFCLPSSFSSGSCKPNMQPILMLCVCMCVCVYVCMAPIDHSAVSVSFFFFLLFFFVFFFPLFRMVCRCSHLGGTKNASSGTQRRSFWSPNNNNNRRMRRRRTKSRKCDTPIGPPPSQCQTNGWCCWHTHNTPLIYSHSLSLSLSLSHTHTHTTHFPLHCHMGDLSICLSICLSIFLALVLANSIVFS